MRQRGIMHKLKHVQRLGRTARHIFAWPRLAKSNWSNVAMAWSGIKHHTGQFLCKVYFQMQLICGAVCAVRVQDDPFSVFSIYCAI